MDSDGEYAVENEAQFWAGLDDILAASYDTSELIDDALRAFLAFTTNFKQEYLQSEYDIARCCYRLLDAAIFKDNQDYVRRQILYCLLQEDDADTLHLTAAVLLFDGRANEAAFEMMQAESAFPRLVELVRARRDDEIGLHRLLLELLFEMSRIQKLSRDELMTVDDAFILHLFQLIEELSDDADDPYHYPIIRVLLVLNEQYMCLANAPSSPGDGPIALTNRILKLLSMHGPAYRTFGENLILLLNRESKLGPQLLILKLLYLLFTTPSTYEYFYTNDLHVLVDVIIRNLLDLDPVSDHSPHLSDGVDRDGQRALQHTYLRVLCPLLRNTQLSLDGNHYKREEVRRLLFLLVNKSSAHFAPVDATVLRLAVRIKQIEWLREAGDEEDDAMEQQLLEAAPTDAQVAKKLLGMSLSDAGESSLSVVEVSAKIAKEKPSVPAPRRRRQGSKANGESSNSNGPDTGDLLRVPPKGVDLPRGDTRSPFSDENAET
ncbi:related to Orc3p [Ramularia collo-cygni]|uniref:Related to Orc3p n=1 Tax=Ramularia collo-cygni TaxID=112498 RepID=A0A2D3V7N2_9PEZI|nr:related to Orc3p [Ramularia collo-cygni]CZT18574.1 related to Orc3p [Ramularia collo-cygni]